MLFLQYFELNENMSAEERLQIGQKLTSSGLFPPKGVKLLQWLLTPDGWGINISEVESVADGFRATQMWRAAGKGFFKSVKTAPAMPITEAMPIGAEILKALSST